MSFPLIWIIIPIGVAFLALFFDQNKRVKQGILVVFALVLSILAFINPFSGSIGEAGAAISESFEILGRRLVLTNEELGLIGVIYLLVFLWNLNSYIRTDQQYFSEFSMIYAALNIASFSIEPFLYSAPILFIANLIFIPIFAQGRYRKITGRLRFLLYQLLAVFLVLLAGWVLAGGEIAPVDEEQLFFSTILLGLGIALWLGAYPFHTWIPLLAEEISILPFGLLMSFMPVSSILLLLNFINDFSWLRDYQVFYTAFQFLGVVMVLVGAFSAFFQREMDRLIANLYISSIGVLLLSAGIVNEISTDVLASWIIPFFFVILSMTIAISNLLKKEKNWNIARLSGKFDKDPYNTLLLISGILTLLGFPFFLGNIATLQLQGVLYSTFPIYFYLYLLSLFLIILVLIRLLMRFFQKSNEPRENIWKLNEENIGILLLILINVYIAFFPGLIHGNMIRLLGDIFPFL